ncbi:hypothetical protein [Aliiglaciecola sp. LCG003]|uniref:hypothetical protein n=1 Tax=Aliiglaciecola sp. LCG003 TaxID=3053655 RepID=UPI0025743B26|nr:hypothetical protein [Aliiglaciecola sp. LCG003]WJG09370.1 hypothetical protein QR722_18895 [Aliiglaciecola sp. LCG003]
MRKTSPDAWMFVVFIIGVIVIPILVGMTVLKLYRQVKPLPEIDPKASSFVHLDQIQQDSFFKITLVGWLITGPIFYFIYATYLS